MLRIRVIGEGDLFSHSFYWSPICPGTYTPRTLSPTSFSLFSPNSNRKEHFSDNQFAYQLWTTDKALILPNFFVTFPTQRFCGLLVSGWHCVGYFCLYMLLFCWSLGVGCNAPSPVTLTGQMPGETSFPRGTPLRLTFVVFSNMRFSMFTFKCCCCVLRQGIFLYQQLVFQFIGVLLLF